MAGLTTQQQRFVEEYLIDLNATQAAIRAGYSQKTAYSQGQRLLKNVEIGKTISEAQKKREERTNITQDYVLQSITETIERCKQAVPVLDKKGNPLMIETAGGELAPAYTFQAANVLKGSELLGKHLGMFVDRSQINQTVNVVSADPMTEDDWEAQHTEEQHTGD